jgi:hypothetical protein
MQVHDITKTALDAYLKGLRLPLTVAESVLKPRQPWAPAVGFEHVEAAVRGAVGSLLRDEELTNEAALQRARLTQLDRATEKLARAEAVEEQAARQSEQAERTRVQGTRAVAEKTAKKKAAVRKAAAAREDVVERREAAAERKRLAAERTALQKQQRAVRAKKTADAVR